MEDPKKKPPEQQPDVSAEGVERTAEGKSAVEPPVPEEVTKAVLDARAKQRNKVVTGNDQLPFAVQMDDGSLVSVKKDAPAEAKSEQHPRQVEVQAEHRLALSGTFSSPDGKTTYTVKDGQLFDGQGKFLGSLAKDGKFVPSDEKHQPTDLNSVFDGWKFEGTEGNQTRRFECRADLAQGKIEFRTDSESATRCEVRFGMLINTATGEQLGTLIPPRESTNGKLEGGFVNLIGPPPKQVPLSDLTGSVFDLELIGQTGIRGRRLQAVCLGHDRLADGTPKPGSGGLFNLQDAADAFRDRKKEVQQKQKQYVSGYHPLDRMSGTREEKIREFKKQIESLDGRLAQLEQISKDGRADKATLAEIGKAVEDVRTPEDALVAQRRNLDMGERKLEELPRDPSTIEGTVRIPVADANGKIVGQKVHKIEGGNIIGEDGQPSARIENRNGQMFVVDIKSGQALAASAITRSLWNLKFSDSTGKQDVHWAALPDGTMVSLADLRERAHAEVKYARTIHDQTKNEGTYKTLDETERKSWDFKSKLDHIAANGIGDPSDLQVLMNGIREVRVPAAGDSNKPVHRVEIPVLAEKSDPERNHFDAGKISGMARIGSDIYEIRNGDLYVPGNAKSVGKIGPGYVAEIEGKGKIPLAEQPRVVLKFKIDGDPSGREHRLIGLGPQRVGENGERIQGGLVQADQLLLEVLEARQRANDGDRKYFDNKPYLNSFLGLDAPDQALEHMKSNMNALTEMSRNQITFLFDNAFKPELQNNNVDLSVKSIQELVTTLGVTASTSESLAAEGQQLQTQISDSIVMGVTTAATAGVGTFFQGLSATSKLGIAAVRGAELATGTVVGATSSVVGRASVVSDDGRNAVAGGLEGAANTLSFMGGREIAKLAEANKIGIKAYGAYKLADATFQSTINTAASSYRLKDWNSFNVQSIALGTGAQLLGDGIGWGISAGAGKIASAAERRLAGALGDTGTAAQLCKAADISPDDLLHLYSKNPQKFRELVNAAGANYDHVVQDIGAMSMARKAFGLSSDGLAGDLIRDTSSGYGNAFSSAVPEAIEQERERIAALLGLKKEQVTGDLLQSRLDWNNVMAYANESGKMGAVSAGIGNLAAAGAKGLVEPFAPKKDPQPGTMQRTSADTPGSADVPVRSEVPGSADVPVRSEVPGSADVPSASKQPRGPADESRDATKREKGADRTATSAGARTPDGDTDLYTLADAVGKNKHLYLGTTDGDGIWFPPDRIGELPSEAKIAWWKELRPFMSPLAQREHAQAFIEHVSRVMESWHPLPSDASPAILAARGHELQAAINDFWTKHSGSEGSMPELPPTRINYWSSNEMKGSSGSYIPGTGEINLPREILFGKGDIPRILRTVHHERIHSWQDYLLVRRLADEVDDTLGTNFSTDIDKDLLQSGYEARTGYRLSPDYMEEVLRVRNGRNLADENPAWDAWSLQIEKSLRALSDGTGGKVKPEYDATFPAVESCQKALRLLRDSAGDQSRELLNTLAQDKEFARRLFGNADFPVELQSYAKAAESGQAWREADARAAVDQYLARRIEELNQVRQESWSPYMTPAEIETHFSDRLSHFWAKQHQREQYADLAKANKLSAAKDYEGAIPHYEQAAKNAADRFGPEHFRVAQCLDGLAHCKDSMGDIAGARELYRRSLEIKEKQLHPDDLSIADTLRGLAHCSVSAERDQFSKRAHQIEANNRERAFKEHEQTAERLMGQYFYRSAAEHFKAILVSRQVLGEPDGVKLLPCLEGLARCKMKMGDHAEAAPYIERILKLKQADTSNDSYLRTCSELAECYRELRRYAEAEQLYKTLASSSLRGDEYTRVEDLCSLADCQEKQSKHVEAEATYRELLKLQPDAPYFLRPLGQALLGQGKHAEALATFNRSLETDKQEGSFERSDRAEIGLARADCLYQLGRVDEAKQVYKDALRETKQEWGAGAQVADGLERMARCYQGREAELIRESAAELRRREAEKTETPVATSTRSDATDEFDDLNQLARMFKSGTLETYQRQQADAASQSSRRQKAAARKRKSGSTDEEWQSLEELMALVEDLTEDTPPSAPAANEPQIPPGGITLPPVGDDLPAAVNDLSSSRRAPGSNEKKLSKETGDVDAMAGASDATPSAAPEHTLNQIFGARKHLYVGRENKYGLWCPPDSIGELPSEGKIAWWKDLRPFISPLVNRSVSQKFVHDVYAIVSNWHVLPSNAPESSLQIRAAQLESAIKSFTSHAEGQLKVKLPEVTLNFKPDKELSAAGTYSPGEGVINLPRSVLFGGHDVSQLLRTIYHERIHSWQDYLVIRALADESKLGSNPPKIDIVDLQWLYKKRTGYTLSDGFVRHVLSKRAGEKLPEHQKAWAKHIEKSWKDLTDGKAGKVRPEYDKTRDAAVACMSALKTLREGSDNSAKVVLSEVANDKNFERSLFGPKEVPAELKPLIEKVKSGSSDWAEAEARTLLEQAIAERIKKLNKVRQEAWSPYMTPAETESHFVDRLTHFWAKRYEKELSRESQLAVKCRDNKDYAGAERHFEHSLKVLSTELGQDHLKVAMCLENLAACKLILNKAAEAQKLYESALALREAIVGLDHESLVPVLRGLNQCTSEKHQLDRAQLIEKKHLQAKIDEDQRKAFQQFVAGDYAAARTAYGAVLNNLRKLLPPYDLQIRECLTELASCSQKLGKHQDAIIQLKQVSKAQEQAKAPADECACTIVKMSDSYRALNRYADAELGYSKALELMDTSPRSAGDRDIDVNGVEMTLTRLGSCQEAQGKFAAAEQTYLKLVERLPGAPWVVRALADCQQKQRRFAEALRSYGQALSDNVRNQHYRSGEAAEIAVSAMNCATQLGQSTEALKFRNQARSLYEAELKSRLKQDGAASVSVAQCLECMAPLFDSDKSKVMLAQAKQIRDALSKLKASSGQHDKPFTPASQSGDEDFYLGIHLDFPERLNAELANEPAWKVSAAKTAYGYAIDEVGGQTNLLPSYRKHFGELTAWGEAGYYEKIGNLDGYVRLIKHFDERYATLLSGVLRDFQQRNFCNPFDLVPGFKPKAFMETFRALFGGEPTDLALARIAKGSDEFDADSGGRDFCDKHAWNSAVTALRLTLVFGNGTQQWLKRQASLGRSVHDATYWLPIEPARKVEGLGQWLLANSEAKPSILELVTTRWSDLPPHYKKSDWKEAVGFLRALSYKDAEHLKFASECALWGIHEREYKSFEARFLKSLDIPSPFPLDKVWSAGDLRGRFLPRDDVRGLFLGQHTDCCQHPHGAGAECAWYGQESPRSGFFAVENAKGEIIAQSWAWISDDGGLCFDNIEAKDLGTRDQRVMQVYEQAARDLSNEFHTVTLGSTSDVFAQHWKVDRLAELSPPSDYDGYRDSEDQVILAENPSYRESLREARLEVDAEVVRRDRAIGEAEDEFDRSTAPDREAREFETSAAQRAYEEVEVRATERLRSQFEKAEQTAQREIEQAAADRDESLSHCFDSDTNTRASIERTFETARQDAIEKMKDYTARAQAEYDAECGFARAIRSDARAISAEKYRKAVGQHELQRDWRLEKAESDFQNSQAVQAFRRASSIAKRKFNADGSAHPPSEPQSIDTKPLEAKALPGIADIPYAPPEPLPKVGAKSHLYLGTTDGDGVWNPPKRIGELPSEAKIAWWKELKPYITPLSRRQTAQKFVEQMYAVLKDWRPLPKNADPALLQERARQLEQVVNGLSDAEGSHLNQAMPKVKIVFLSQKDLNGHNSTAKEVEAGGGYAPGTGKIALPNSLVYARDLDIPKLITTIYHERVHNWQDYLVARRLADRLRLTAEAGSEQKMALRELYEAATDGLMTDEFAESVLKARNGKSLKEESKEWYEWAGQLEAALLNFSRGGAELGPEFAKTLEPIAAYKRAREMLNEYSAYRLTSMLAEDLGFAQDLFDAAEPPESLAKYFKQLAGPREKFAELPAQKALEDYLAARILQLNEKRKQAWSPYMDAPEIEAHFVDRLTHFWARKYEKALLTRKSAERLQRHRDSRAANRHEGSDPDDQPHSDASDIFRCFRKLDPTDETAEHASVRGELNSFADYTKLAERGWTERQVREVNALFDRALASDDDYNECTDNFRFARVDNPEEMQEFHRREADGCCGFFDDEIEVDGQKIRIGFNYGH